LTDWAGVEGRMLKLPTTLVTLPAVIDPEDVRTDV
jgi:hypothetical protein